MSVSRSGDGDYSYHHLDQQNIMVETSLAGPSDGNRSRHFEQVDPAGGLQHGEIAELVGYETHCMTRLSSATNITAQNVLYCEHISGINFNLDDVPSSSSESPSEVDDTGANVSVRNYNSNQLLEEFFTYHEVQVYDTTNSTGAGGPGSNYYNNAVWYPDLGFERGPLLTKNDDMEFSSDFLALLGGGAANFEDAWYVNFYWRIHETNDFPNIDFV